KRRQEYQGDLSLKILIEILCIRNYWIFITESLNRGMKMLKKIKTFKVHDIYYKSPIFIQHVTTSAYGYKLKRERYRKIYQNALKSYVKGDFDKEQKLIHFMNHLKKNIADYQNIEVDEDNIMKRFFKLPFTVKNELRNELEARSWKEGIIRLSRTSGTTGANLIVYDS